MKKLFFLLLLFTLFFNYVNAEEDIIDKIFQKKLEEERLQEKKQNADYFIEIADKAYEQGDYLTAEENYLTAYGMRPQSPDLKVKHMKSKALRYFEKYRPALFIIFGIFIISSIMNFASKYSKNSGKRLENSKINELKKLKEDFLKGKYDLVIKKARALNEKKYDFTIPDKFFINATLAKSYYKKGTYTSAKKYAVSALKLKSVSPELHDILCDIFLRLKDTSPRAIKEYEIKLKKNPNDNKIVNILFDYYYARKDITEEAMNIYYKIYRYNPENKEALDMICLKGIRKQDIGADMIKVYENTLKKIRPDDMKLKALLIKTYYTNKKYDKCYNLIKEIIGLKDFVEDKNLHKMFFDSAKAVKKLEEMKSIYSDLREKYPDSVVLANIFEDHSNRSDDVALEDKLKKGDDIAGKGIKICPVCAHINLKDAKFCEKCGKPLNI